MSSSVPEGWEETCLSTLVSVDSESLEGSTDPEYKFKYIDISCVSTGSVTPPSQHILFQNAPSRAKRVVRQNDVLIATVRPNLKAFAHFDEEGEDWVASTGFAVLRMKEWADSRFIFNVMVSDEVSGQIDKLVAGSNYPAINSSDVKDLIVLSPPLPEQKKIASILTSVDEVIENTQKQIDKLQDLKKATVNELLTKGIGHTEFKDSELGRIPKSWEVKTLSTICKKIADRDHTTPEYVHKSDGVPIVSPTNLDADMELDLTKLKYVSFEAHEKNQKKTDLSPDDIIFSRIGAGLGKSYLVTSSFYNFSILHSLCQIRADKNLISPTYLLWQMRTRKFQDRLWLGVQSIGVPDLGLGEIGHLKVPVCSLDEQQRITKHLESVQSYILQKKSLLKKHQSLKKSLMQDLLTGKVRVRMN